MANNFNFVWYFAAALSPSKRANNSCVMFSLREASRYLKFYRHFDNIKRWMEHQTRPHSKENTIERKYISVWFSSVSLPNPCFLRLIRPKKVVLFRKSAGWKIFYYLRAWINRMCMRYIFLFQKNTQTKKFPLANLFSSIYIFSLQKIKDRAPLFFKKENYC